MNIKEAGQAKAVLYAEHKTRYKRAMHAGCYLECVLIDYAMMEDRLLSILFHMGIVDRQSGNKPSWSNRGWARQGYRNCLSGIMTSDGKLPSLRSISTKRKIVEQLSRLVAPAERCSSYEVWLRTTAKDKLVQCDALGLCEEIDCWVNTRNVLVHALFSAGSQPYDADEMRRFAEEGMLLASRLDSLSGKMNTLMRRYRKAQGEAKRNGAGRT